MSLHDKLARKATAAGKSSSEFKAAAQKWANSTWFWVIAVGVVWYFLGWGWALIPAAFGILAILQSVSATLVAMRLEKAEQNTESIDPEFVKIVQEYGKILETSAPNPGTVADESNLPYTKQQIKHAIVAALGITDDPQMRDHLKVGYIQLADWQEGVGGSNQGIDALALDMNQDPKELASTVLKQSEGSEKWIALAREEEEELKQELQAKGLW